MGFLRHVADQARLVWIIGLLFSFFTNAQTNPTERTPSDLNPREVYDLLFLRGPDRLIGAEHLFEVLHKNQKHRRHINAVLAESEWMKERALTGLAFREEYLATLKSHFPELGTDYPWVVSPITTLFEEYNRLRQYRMQPQPLPDYRIRAIALEHLRTKLGLSTLTEDILRRDFPDQWIEYKDYVKRLENHTEPRRTPLPTVDDDEFEDWKKRTLETIDRIRIKNIQNLLTMVEEHGERSKPAVVRKVKRVPNDVFDENNNSEFRWALDPSHHLIKIPIPELLRNIRFDVTKRGFLDEREAMIEVQKYPIWKRVLVGLLNIRKLPTKVRASLGGTEDLKWEDNSRVKKVGTFYHFGRDTTQHWVILENDEDEENVHPEFPYVRITVENFHRLIYDLIKNFSGKSSVASRRTRRYMEETLFRELLLLEAREVLTGNDGTNESSHSFEERLRGALQERKGSDAWSSLSISDQLNLTNGNSPEDLVTGVEWLGHEVGAKYWRNRDQLLNGEHFLRAEPREEVRKSIDRRETEFDQSRWETSENGWSIPKQIMRYENRLLKKGRLPLYLAQALFPVMIYGLGLGLDKALDDRNFSQQTVFGEGEKVTTTVYGKKQPKAVLRPIKRTVGTNSGLTDKPGSKENPWVFRVEDLSGKTLPQHYYHPFTEDFNEHYFVDWNPDINENTSIDLLLKSLIVFETNSNGYLFLPRPQGHELLSLVLTKVTSSGTDNHYTKSPVYVDIRTGNYWVKPERDGKYKILTNFTRTQNVFQSSEEIGPELEQLDPAILDRLTGHLQELGFVRLSKALSIALEERPNGISLKDLEQIFEKNMYYSHVEENKKKGRRTQEKFPNNPFAKYSKFESHGELFLECDGSNDFLADFLNEYLHLAGLNHEFGVTVLRAFARPPKSSRVPFAPGHLQTLLFKKDGTVRVMLDATPIISRDPDDLLSEREKHPPRPEPPNGRNRLLEMARVESGGTDDHLKKYHETRKRRYQEMRSALMNSRGMHAAISTKHTGLPHRRVTQVGDALVNYSDRILSHKELVEQLSEWYPRLAKREWEKADLNDILGSIHAEEQRQYGRYAKAPELAEEDLGHRFEALYQYNYLKDTLELVDFLAKTNWMPIERLSIEIKTELDACDTALTYLFR